MAKLKEGDIFHEKACVLADLDAIEAIQKKGDVTDIQEIAKLVAAYKKTPVYEQAVSEYGDLFREMFA